RLCPDRRTQSRPLRDRRTAQLPALPARPLRRVQPGLRSRHAVRPAVGRAHRIDPGVDAATGPLGLRLDARTGLARSGADRTLSGPARMGLKRRRVGLLGGTFDPVHVGHLALARAACVALSIDELRLVPTGVSSQRDGSSPAADRVAMLRLAIAGEPDWIIDTREVEREGPSYTIDTLASLRAELGPECALVLIIGSDQLRNLASWHRWRELLDLCHIA